MFKISSYLQFRNTPDGKPKVLVEGVDYEYTDKNTLYADFRALEDGVGISKKDCRPLLTVEVIGVEWTEGHIAVDRGQLKIIYMVEENGVYKMAGRKPSELWNDDDEGFIYNCEKLGSFFDNPKKYSKLLWNCSEKEGWEKIFELLKIK